MFIVGFQPGEGRGVGVVVVGGGGVVLLHPHLKLGFLAQAEMWKLRDFYILLSRQREGLTHGGRFSFCGQKVD